MNRHAPVWSSYCILFPISQEQHLFMMKITLFALIILPAILKSCNVNAKYTAQGNHWWKDGTLPNGKEDIKLFTDIVKSEFENLFKLHDAALMAEKYTNDCVYIREDIGILRGREVREAYQEVFDSGIDSVELEILEETDVGMLGTGYMQFINVMHFFDKDHNSMGVSKILTILKHVDGGYETYLKAEITE
ncbi:uncharacterized protein [Amphiura filiformis]|uniref:uncharacterized protein isoform X2 n=1 Tax=Amphiura filiformis TaxID=82378 RepID=UPI003B21D9EA